MTTPASARRVAMACLVGTSIEWYDFFICGTASALVPEAVLPFLRPRGRDAAVVLHIRARVPPRNRHKINVNIGNEKR
jgi:hypothetical protein